MLLCKYLDGSNGTPNPVCNNQGALEEVIESLKVKIREQEEQLENKQEPPKCLICMVSRTRNLISTNF